MDIKAFALGAFLVLPHSGFDKVAGCSSIQSPDTLTVICDTKDLILPLCEILATDINFKGNCGELINGGFQADMLSPAGWGDSN